jgi:hypothetical protein
MLAIFVAAFMAAAAPSPLEMARDKQDRAVLRELAAQAGAAADKAPNDAAAQYRAALANCYLAEVNWAITKAAVRSPSRASGSPRRRLQ